MVKLVFIAGLFLVSGCSGKAVKPEQPPVSVITILPVVIGKIPHDPAAFTQGLEFSSGRFYESTGIHGQSSLRLCDTVGNILRKHMLDNAYFAEGCAIAGEKIYQLTWQEQVCFVYRAHDFAPLDTLIYTGEGWGLATDGNRFFMSNGSDSISIRDLNFKEVKRLPVTSGRLPLGNLNELEFVNGKLYANVWFSDYVFEINTQSGEVERIIDCSAIVKLEAPASEQAVLNGIAYDPAGSRFFITGKNWKNIYIVTFGG